MAVVRKPRVLYLFLMCLVLRHDRILTKILHQTNFECKVCQTVLETVHIHKGYKIASTTKTWGKCAIHNSLSSLPSSGAFTGAFLALPGRPTVSTVHQSHSRRACRPAGAFAGRFGVISARPAERRDGKDWPTKESKSQGCF